MTVTPSSSRPGAPARLGSRLLRLLRPAELRGGRHRDVQGSGARAAVLGSGDGLLTNISLVLGVAGAGTSGSAVRVAGVAGLLAGAFSMAAGELVSVKAHGELVQHEIDVEHAELADDPAGEHRELAAMHGLSTTAKGVTVLAFTPLLFVASLFLWWARRGRGPAPRWLGALGPRAWFRVVMIAALGDVALLVLGGASP